MNVMDVSSGSGVASPGDAKPPVGPPSRDRETILAALAAMPEELGRTLHDHAIEDLMRPSRDGGWGVIEILCHLRDWDEIFLDRFKSTVEQERPFLPAYDDELWPIERDYRGQNPVKTFERFQDLRTEVVAFLTDLPPRDWDRPAVHGAYGPVTLHWLADHVCDHDREHLEQVRDALA